MTTIVTPADVERCTRPLSEWDESVETTIEQRTVLGGDIHTPYRPRYSRIG